jgi:hypothetical protein
MTGFAAPSSESVRADAKVQQYLLNSRRARKDALSWLFFDNAVIGSCDLPTPNFSTYSEAV